LKITKNASSFNEHDDAPLSLSEIGLDLSVDEFEDDDNEN